MKKFERALVNFTNIWIDKNYRHRLRISEHVPNKFERSKVSRAQILQIINQIDIDEQKTK